MHASRRQLIAAVGLVAVAPTRRLVARADILTPESFGARGDGHSNDTRAFSALSRYINEHGGGTIELRPVTYIVGSQFLHFEERNAVAFRSVNILRFVKCAGPLIIRGNGATLRTASGLRFGTFDGRSGRPFEHELPFYNRDYIATPYQAMIMVERCTGLVEISNLELDGNVRQLWIGGQFGNSGWQIPASGIRLVENVGPERLAHIRIHHQPLDGLTIVGSTSRSSTSSISNVLCEHNSRQGCSLTSGRNYRFEQCRFAHTGRAAVHSGPSAGFDIEAESKTIRNIRFSECEFSDNAGSGVDVDSGDTEEIAFNRCRFVGTTSWSAWPRKPRMVFSNCTFVGAMVHPYGDRVPQRAARFLHCSFVDDPAMSPTGRVYLGEGPTNPIVNAPSAENARFDACRFHLTGAGILPFTRNVIYSDCTMSQQSSVRSHPGGTYLGINNLNGNIDLSGATISGNVTLNGRVLRRIG